MKQIGFALMLGLYLGASAWCAEVPAESPRVTSTVRLIRNLKDGVVAVFSDGKDFFIAGSGSVIHESGFILTNNHVVEDRPGHVLFADGTVLTYELFGRITEKDIAVIKVKADHPFTRIPPGHSNDLMAGEPILVMGNPGARGLVFSSGILSSTGIFPKGPNALAMARFQESTRDRFLQFDATSNQGNSGGPLVNAEGRQIGMVTLKDPHENNTNYAIPMDRIRAWLLDLLAPEERYGIWLGIKIDMQAEHAAVTAVEKDSPAAQAGVKAGDVITAVEHEPVRDPIDWLLGVCRTKGTKSLAFTVQRDGKSIDIGTERDPYPAPKLEAAEGKKSGLQYTLYYAEHLQTLPDFSKLTPETSGVASNLDPTLLAGLRKEHYAIVYEGYLKLDGEGFQRLVLSIDDGARLFLDGRLVLEDDGPHAPQEASGPICVHPGLHHLRIEYYNGVGAGELKLFLRPNGGWQREITPAEFFHD